MNPRRPLPESRREKAPRTTTGESRGERLSRARSMSTDNDTWDLSENDQRAIATVLSDRQEAIDIAKLLRTACQTSLDLLQHMTSDTFQQGGDRAVRERLEEAIERATLDLNELERQS